MPDVTASYETPPDFIIYFLKIFIHKWRPFMFELLYHHKTFKNYVSDKYSYFDISIYQMWLQVMEGLLILLRFWVFSYIVDEHSCLKYCIFTKLLQIVCLINVHILVCQHAKCDCRLWKVFWFDCVFSAFSYITTCSNFIILLQIVCQGRSVEMKSKPM